MRFIQTTAGKLSFEISRTEKRLLGEILKLYPLVPASHHKLSHSADPKEIESTQQLLEEAVAEQRRENQQQLMTSWESGELFVKAGSGQRLTVSAAQAEMLLQVLNDIRVGAWLRLGSPDSKDARPVKLQADSLRLYFTMEYCGGVQSALLEALNGQREIPPL